MEAALTDRDSELGCSISPLLGQRTELTVFFCFDP